MEKADDANGRVTLTKADMAMNSIYEKVNKLQNLQEQEC